METDAGTQTRVLKFASSETPQPRPTRGHGHARQAGLAGKTRSRCGRRGAKPAAAVLPYGEISQGHDDQYAAGYLRKNGVPYSENAVLTEYYDLFQERDGTTMMIVTIAVDRIPCFWNADISW